MQRKAQEKAGVGQTDAAIEMLKDYLASLDKQQIDPQQAALLRGRSRSVCRSSRSSKSRKTDMPPKPARTR